MSWRKVLYEVGYDEEADFDLSRHQELNSMEIKVLWERDYWDGPLNGVAEYKGKKCWFDFIVMNEADPSVNTLGVRHLGSYNYALYPMTEEQVAEWERLGDKWRQEQPEYMGPDFTGVEPLGWFHEGGNQDFWMINVEKGENADGSSGIP